MRSEDFRAEPSLDAGLVLIDLGADRGVPDGYARPERSTVPGWLPPLLVALLVLVSSAASAAPPAPPLSQLLSVEVQPGDSYALTDDGMLLVHAPMAGTLTGYELSTGRLRWTTGATVPAYRVRSGAGLVLLRTRSASLSDPGTVALSAATGQTRWRVGGSILTIAGSPTVLSVSEVRSFSGEGRRVEGPVAGLDPHTGRARWTLSVSSTAVLLGLPGIPATGSTTSAGSGASAPAPRVLLVHDNGLAGLHDLATGRRVAAAQLPPADYGPGNPGLIGGMLMLRHPSDSGPEIAAYDPATLQRRWTASAAAAYDMRACGGLVCLIGRFGVRAVDPADGAQRWYRPGWRGVEQRGGVLLAYGALTGDADLMGTVDAGTGRMTIALRQWRPVPGAGGGDHVLVTSSGTGAPRTMVGVADPGTGRLRPLGDLPEGTGDCRAVPDRLICRSQDGELIVWAYSWR